MEKKNKQGLTESEFLAAYQPKNYPRPSVTADVIVFREIQSQHEVLLVQRGNHPYIGKWALPGGFVQENESVQEAALRELKEETHVSDIPVEAVGLFSKPGRDPRTWVISEAYAAKMKGDKVQVQAGDDADDAVWFHIQAYNQTEKDGKLFLTFEAFQHGKFQAVLQKKVVPGVLGERIEYLVEDSGELAFDHACMIACAMQKLCLL